MNLYSAVIAAAYRDGVASFERAAAQRRPFPALDPEPPPRPWWRRLMIPVALLALAAAVVAAAALRPFSRVAAGPAAAGNSVRLAGLSGRIAALTTAGGLVLADPDGGHVTRAMANVGATVSAAPDGRYLALVNGQVFTVRPGPALAIDHTDVPLTSQAASAWPDPFTDHERALVMLLDFGDPTQSSSNPISVVSLATGRAVSLGVGDQVAGDPQAPGVFVSVAAPAAPSATSVPAGSDSGIVLRDAGRPDVVLATAGALNSDLGYARNLPAALVPWPSPSGAEVAVAVRPEGSSVTGIVVLSRTGRLLGHVVTPLGTQGGPDWSPSGTSLAYLTDAPGGEAPQLSVWTIGRPAVASELPAGRAGRYSTCVWSPDGTSILCASDGTDWVIAGAAGGHVSALVHGPGIPIAWLPASGGR